MNIQHLLIKIVLQAKKFNLFHSLLQFHVFNDSNELAHILIDFDNSSLFQKDYKSKVIIKTFPWSFKRQARCYNS